MINHTPFCIPAALKIQWVTPPPDQIEVGVRINVSYYASISNYSPIPPAFQSFNMTYVRYNFSADVH